MKKDEIKVGGTYLAKVTDRVVPVRLDRENARGGWDATNLVTNKQVRIKSAQRLRGPAERATSAKADAAQHTKAVADAQAADAKANAPATPEAPAKKPTKARAAKAEKPAKVKKTSGLDAAYQVLSHTGEPMRCGDMVEKMLATGLWKTDGKTPLPMPLICSTTNRSISPAAVTVGELTVELRRLSDHILRRLDPEVMGELILPPPLQKASAALARAARSMQRCLDADRD